MFRIEWFAFVVGLMVPMTMAEGALGQPLQGGTAGGADAPGVDAPGSDARRASAQGLFDEARALMADGHHPAACPKLEESQRLDPGLGTQFNLADCYEHVGRTASAWSLFLEVAAIAHQRGQMAREEVARARAEALAGSLSRIAIVVPIEARVAGLVVWRGALEVGEAQWGVPLPVDPGVHVVRAEAPGKQAWSAEVLVKPDAGLYPIRMPTLDDAEPADAAPVPVAADPNVFQQLGTARTVALGLGAGGALALGVGSVFGLLAMSKAADSEAGCDGNACNQTGYDDRQLARQHGDVATVAFLTGGALLAAGAIVFLLGEPAPEAPAVTLAPRGAGLTATASF